MNRVIGISFQRSWFSHNRGGWIKESNGIYFRDTFASSVCYLSSAVLMGHIQVHAPGGAQLWFSRRQVLVNAKNAFWTMTAWKDEAVMNAYRTGLIGATRPLSCIGTKKPQNFLLGKRHIDAWW